MRLISLRMALTPPARSTSSRWTSLAGATLQMWGTRAAISLMRWQRVVDAALVGQGQRVEDGVRRAAHRHVQREGVVQRLRRHDLARRQVGLQQLHDLARRLPVELVALFAVGQDRAVAGQRRGRSLP